jgi:hypothetical protein
MTDMIAVAIVDLLAGPALDFAVAKALGIEVGVSHLSTADIRQATARDIGVSDRHLWCGAFGHGSVVFSPSTSWDSAKAVIGPLEIACWHRVGDVHKFEFSSRESGGIGLGSTMLEAACIAFVKSKFGDAVSVPRALWGGK